MHKVIILHPLDLTEKKLEVLDSVRCEALCMLHKHILPILDKVDDSGGLQKKIYHKIRKNSSIHSQVLLNLIHNSMSLKEKPPESRNVQYVTLDCNIPRAAKVFTLESGTYCMKLHLAKGKSVVIPIRRNRMLQRLESHTAVGWTIKQVGISMNNRILVVVEKLKKCIKVRNILGVDVNANNLAITVINRKGKALKQLYLGYGVWQHKARILERKAKLQSLADTGSCRAKTSLRKLSHKLRNFTKNNTGELAKQLHEIALNYNATIVMENLTKFPVDKGKDANRKISLIPFALLRERIITRSIDDGVPLGYVDPYHTSKWCPRCGSVNPSHSKPYAIYRCSSCGLIVNSDRKASYAIAVKKLLERKKHNTHHVYAQFSKREVPVNGLFRRNEEQTNHPGGLMSSLSPTKAPCVSMG